MRTTAVPHSPMGAAATASTVMVAPAPATEGDEPGANRGSRRSRGDAGGSSTVIEDEFLVEGKLEKPSAYYILRRSSLDYDWARLDAKFSPLVLESVQDPLF